MGALRGVKGAVPKDQESGRSHPLPAAGSGAQGAALVAEEPAGRPPAVGDLAAFFRRAQRPADRVGALPAAPLAAHLEARHRPLLAAGPAAGALAAQARLPDPPAAAPEAPRRKQPRALRSPPAEGSRWEGNPPAGASQPNHAQVVGKQAERRAVPIRALPGSRVPGAAKRARPGAAPVPAPRAGPSPAEAARVPARGAAPGGRFSCPRAQCPRRDYSQVAALFPRLTRVRIDAGERRTT